jgi:hypothetical protein
MPSIKQGKILQYNPDSVYSASKVLSSRALANMSYNPDIASNIKTSSNVKSDYAEFMGMLNDIDSQIIYLSSYEKKAKKTFMSSLARDGIVRRGADYNHFFGLNPYDNPDPRKKLEAVTYGSGREGLSKIKKHSSLNPTMAAATSTNEMLDEEPEFIDEEPTPRYTKNFVGRPEPASTAFSSDSNLFGLTSHSVNTTPSFLGGGAAGAAKSGIRRRSAPSPPSSGGDSSSSDEDGDDDGGDGDGDGDSDSGISGITDDDLIPRMPDIDQVKTGNENILFKTIIYISSLIQHANIFLNAKIKPYANNLSQVDISELETRINKLRADYLKIEPHLYEVAVEDGSEIYDILKARMSKFLNDMLIIVKSYAPMAMSGRGRFNDSSNFTSAYNFDKPLINYPENIRSCPTKYMM